MATSSAAGVAAAGEEPRKQLPGPVSALGAVLVAALDWGGVEAAQPAASLHVPHQLPAESASGAQPVAASSCSCGMQQAAAPGTAVAVISMLAVCLLRSRIQGCCWWR